MNCAGLIYDDSTHYLDHLAPFCSLLKYPLILCEPSVIELARFYYPDLEIIEESVLNLKLPPHVISCDNLPLLKAAFPHQTCKIFWLPHGNSDKGWDTPFFEGIGETAFVYGQKMVDFMHEKKAFPKTFQIGNFRWEYFLKHREFYEKLSLAPNHSKNILYAPTWDQDNSFWDSLPKLAKKIPADCHLLIKLHPNTFRKFELELSMWEAKYRAPHITFLPNIPPIYPILARCAGYIGDMSSIGYDFLKFDKPLFFLNANPILALHKCGHAIEPANFEFAENSPFSMLRKATYEYTFGPSPNWNLLKEQIEKICRSL